MRTFGLFMVCVVWVSSAWASCADPKCGQWCAPFAARMCFIQSEASNIQHYEVQFRYGDSRDWSLKIILPSTATFVMIPYHELGVKQARIRAVDYKGLTSSWTMATYRNAFLARLVVENESPEPPPPPTIR